MLLSLVHAGPAQAATVPLARRLLRHRPCTAIRKQLHQKLAQEASPVPQVESAQSETPSVGGSVCKYTTMLYCHDDIELLLNMSCIIHRASEW